MSAGHQRSPATAIREARVDDVPRILALVRQLAEYEKLEHEVVANEELLAQTLFGEDRAAEVILAEDNGEAVGFALFFHSYSTFLGRPGIYLEDLFVKPEHRSKGIGKALLAHIARLALERECGRLEWSVLDWNEAAIRFYRSLGAVPMEGWTVHRVTGGALRRLADLC